MITRVLAVYNPELGKDYYIVRKFEKGKWVDVTGYADVFTAFPDLEEAKSIAQRTALGIEYTGRIVAEYGSNDDADGR